MEVLEINNFKTNRVKVILDNGIAFVLYKGDLIKYGVSVGEVDDKNINYILEEILPKRAINRSVNILAERDMTKGMLRDKLTGDGYPEFIIDNIIDKLEANRLINDERFIRGYIEAKSNKKSKNDIMRDLSSKGVDMDQVESIYEELKSNDLLKDEKELIVEILNKKHFVFDEADVNQINKMVQYLARKGFAYDSIRSAMKEQ